MGLVAMFWCDHICLFETAYYILQCGHNVVDIFFSFSLFQHLQVLNYETSPAGNCMSKQKSNVFCLIKELFGLIDWRGLLGLRSLTNQYTVYFHLISAQEERVFYNPQITRRVHGSANFVET